jgi:hypothetical protein
MKSDRSRPRVGVRLALAASGLILFAGCGDTPAPTAADPDAAKQTLERVLSSWQKGETVEGMKKASPSVIVSDMKWDKGAKLTKFEVEGPGKPSGAQQKFRVALWLADANGKEKKEVVQYEVGIDPVQTVFRSMFE